MVESGCLLNQSAPLSSSPLLLLALPHYSASQPSASPRTELGGTYEKTRLETSVKTMRLYLGADVQTISLWVC